MQVKFKHSSEPDSSGTVLSGTSGPHPKKAEAHAPATTGSAAGLWSMCRGAEGQLGASPTPSLCGAGSQLPRGHFGPQIGGIVSVGGIQLRTSLRHAADTLFSNFRDTPLHLLLFRVWRISKNF